MKFSSATGKTKIDTDTKRIIKDNILKLADKNGLVREKARKLMVKIGRPAIDYLAELENHPKAIARWEAVKTLGEIRDPLAAPLLINALDDPSGGVRWLAAEGLAALRETGLAAILEALVIYPETVYLRQGAHHILVRIAETTKDQAIDEMIRILNEPDAAYKIPLLARPYLEKISRKNKSKKVL